MNEAWSGTKPYSVRDLFEFDYSNLNADVAWCKIEGTGWSFREAGRWKRTLVLVLVVSRCCAADVPTGLPFKSNLRPQLRPNNYFRQLLHASRSDHLVLRSLTIGHLRDMNYLWPSMIFVSNLLVYPSFFDIHFVSTLSGFLD